MSNLLYRLGRFAAQHPWRVIGIWLVCAVAVVIASSTVGRDLDDSFTVPGVDSDKALTLLSTAQSDQAGITARVVVAPRNDQTFSDSKKPRLR